MADVDVLIVGAGPTGMALGCELARHGVTFCMIDEAPVPAPPVHAFTLQARTMELLAGLGLGPELLARTRLASPVRVTVHGRTCGALWFDRLGHDTRFGSMFVIAPAQLVAVLTRALRGRGAVAERCTRLVAFAQDAAGVTAALEDVRTGRTREVRARYLVACDGASGRIREALGIPFDATSASHAVVVADGWFTPPTWELGLFVGHRAAVGVAPFPDGTARLVGVHLDAPTPADGPPTLDELRELLRAAEAPLALLDVTWRGRLDVTPGVARHFRAGHVLLAGDAGHVQLPLGGHGLALGIEDAANVAWKLALVLRGGPDALLDSYDAERRPAAAAPAIATRALGILASDRPHLVRFRDPLLPWAIRAVLGVRALRQPVERGLSRLDRGYPRGRFVHELVAGADAAFVAGPRAGDRLPDLPLDAGSLHELVRGPWLHVLACGPCDEAGLEELARRHVGQVAIHRIAHAALTEDALAGLGVTSSAILVIRPDGHIGLRSFGPSLALARAYLDDLTGGVARPQPATTAVAAVP